MKVYLGDGVYVDHDGYHLVLTTENGVDVTNTIYLDSPVYESLVSYVESLKAPTQDPPPKPVVHALTGGRALCWPNRDGVPRDWPEGETFIAMGHPGARDLVTCDLCRSRLIDALDRRSPIQEPRP